MNLKKTLILASLVLAPVTHGAAQAAVPIERSPLMATEQHPAPGLDTIPASAETKANADIIMPHITDSKHVEFPCVKSWKEWACHVTLPTWNVHFGSRVVDMGPTKHVVFMIFASLLTCGFLVTTARLHARHSREIGRPKGRAAGLEALVVYLRNEVFLKALGGHGGERYVPFVLTLFFFILFCNVLGLIPYGSTATGNVAVTGTLAVITMFVVEIAGMKALGAGYINTIVYWPHGMHIGMKIPLTLILTPIEIIGKLTKPFALTIRLFANMVAGHVVLLALMVMMFTFGIFGFPALVMGTAMMFMELLVGVIQAFIFAVLAAVFIGQIRMAHH
jgi:F-type H+-transporting ATPase subunit a